MHTTNLRTSPLCLALAGNLGACFANRARGAYRTTCACGRRVDLRRISAERPFGDVIRSAPTRSAERAIAPHPSLKPQSFMRQIVRAALPLGEGVVLDPFMGGGSTIAAARAMGYESIGIESDPAFFEIAKAAIPPLTTLEVNGDSKLTPKAEGAGRAYLAKDAYGSARMARW